MTMAGVFVALLFIKAGMISAPRESIIIGIILMLPMIIDGSLQYLKKFPSTNYRRAVTGFLFGIGMVIIINIIPLG